MSTQDPSTMKRRQQIVATYQMTKKSDPVIGRWLLGSFLVAGLIGFGVFTILPGGGGTIGLIISIVVGVLCGVLAVLVVFGRRAKNAAYGQIEGQAGAAARVLETLRRGWHHKPAVAVTRQQDLVHRVVGPPGIVLVGEGNPTRVRALLASEKKKHERFASGTPVTEIMVGNEPGEVPLTKLAKHITKLGRAVEPAHITEILSRLKALDAQRSAIPIPKGPMPTSMKGQRGNLRGR